MISLLQLTAELGAELVTASGTPPSARPLSGVHVSELDDPTPYLDGGELLLTTGMPFAGSAGRMREYVGRLAERGVHALGLGLGPWGREVPAGLARACADGGLDLVLVPDGVPFQNVSRAYWRLSLRDDTAGLRDFLGTQASLTRAAMRPDAASAVVRGLAQALGGWAAYVADDGSRPTVWPASAEPLLPHLRREALRLNRAGTHSAATFELHGQAVVAYPIAGPDRTHGFLAIGSGRTLGTADRQVISTACTLLALRARQRELVSGTTATLGSAVVRLLAAGQTEAARLLADEVGLGALPERVRLVALRVGPGGEALPALRAAGSLHRGDGTPDPGQLATALHRVDGPVVLAVVDARPPAPVPAAAPAAEEGAAEAALLALEPRDAQAGPGRAVDGTAGIGGGEGAAGPGGSGGVREAGGVAPRDRAGARIGAAGGPAAPRVAPPDWAGGAVSGEVPLSVVASAVAPVRQAALQAPAGQLVAADSAGDARAEGWITALRAYPRADLAGTVAAYLRRRGHWEDAARELGVHRNSVRHRVTVARQTLGVDLDDPDVAAHLWLALRRAGY